MNGSMLAALSVASLSLFVSACERSVTGSAISPTGSAYHNQMEALPSDDGLGGGGGDGGYGGGYGGGETGGGTTTEPFNPPIRPFFSALNLVAPYPDGPRTNGQPFTCNQVTHPFFGVGSGFTQDITQGTNIELAGVTAAGKNMHWGFYDTAGQLVKERWTGNATAQCVVNQISVSTADLAPGYYYLYASYVGLFTFTGQETFAGNQQAVIGRYVNVIRIR